jgi:7-cyano-7-deazaguanine synthase
VKVLLFSGGIDSTALAWAYRPDRLLFIDYGQIPAAGEERACRAVADTLKLPLDVHRLDLMKFGHGIMAGSTAPPDVPPEFWPYRNQILITLAAMLYAHDGLSEIWVGTVASDKAHPDGRASFLRGIDKVVSVQSGVRVIAPALKLSTLKLVRNTKAPLSLLGWTFSCHTGEWACGTCRGCLKHDNVMRRILKSSQISSR